MLKPAIATTLLLTSLLVGGITGCSESKSADDASSQSNISQSNSDQAQNRSQRREALRKQVEAVLTVEQKQQFETKLKQGEKIREILPALNLTAEQKTKIQDIMKNARTQWQNKNHS
jgi:Spy/CpxP family protein refolding chaperone